MTTDLQDAVEHRPEHRGFEITFGGEDLAFTTTKIADPVPTGRQIAEAAGKNPADEFIILQWLSNGILETIRLDETVDVRGRGTERFLIVRSDRTYLFEIDADRQEWPSRFISGATLKRLARQDAAAFSVWQEKRQGADQEIRNDQIVDLDPAGVEKFYTVLTHTTEG